MVRRNILGSMLPWKRVTKLTRSQRMLSSALVVGDEVIDSEENEYMVVIASPHEVVLHLQPPYDEGVWVHFIFQRDKDGYWMDRDHPHIHLVDELN